MYKYCDSKQVRSVAAELALKYDVQVLCITYSVAAELSRKY